MMKILKLIGCSLSLLALPLAGQAQNGGKLFRDMNAPQHERLLDLLSRLTIEEKISLLVNDAREIPRLNIIMETKLCTVLSARVSLRYFLKLSGWRQLGIPG